MSTLPALLERAAASGGGGLRFIDRRENELFLDWAEILRRALASASWLIANGVRPGDRVALVYRTCPAFFDAFLGTLLAGAAPAPLYPPVRLGHLREYHRRTASMIDAADARLVLAEPFVARLLGETMANCSPATRLEIFAGGAELPTPNAAPVTRTGSDLALVQFSSGTTVDPKPVALSHAAILAQVEAINHHWRSLPEATGVSWLPLYHDMGLIGCLFPAQEARTELTLIPPELFVARPAIWLRTLSRYRGTLSPAPNFAYGLCLDKISDEELEGVDLSSWQVALNGAEAVSPTTMRRFSERFSRWGLRPEALSPVYGLSEASLAVTFSALDQPFTSRTFDRQLLAGEARAVTATDGQELVSVGRPLAGFEIEVRDGAGRILPPEYVGRIWVRGPSLMDGYLGQPEATARVLVTGWLDTGDQGFLTGGELYLTGRIKDVLILRGRNYQPEEVERAVDGLPGVRTGCSVAVSHRAPDAASDSLLLFVELRSGSSLSPETVGETCQRRVLEVTGLAVDGLFLLPPSTLPRTSSGKLRRGATLARHLRGALEPPARTSWWRMLWALVRSRRALASRANG